MEPFEVELAAFKNSFRCQKVFYIKNKKNYLPDLSHDVRKSFSANESYYFLFYIKDLKPATVTYAFL